MGKSWKNDVRELGYTISDKVEYNAEMVSEMEFVLKEYFGNVITLRETRNCVESLLKGYDVWQEEA